MPKLEIDSVVVLALTISGCALTTTGRYPIPTGPGVEITHTMSEGPKEQISGGTFASVQLPACNATIAIYGYVPDIAFTGPLVPVFPIGQWKWLTGIGKKDLRLIIRMYVTLKSQSLSFPVETLRIMTIGEAHQPSQILSGEYCTDRQKEKLAPVTVPTVMKASSCFVFTFDALRPPAEL